jgi:hypothetical protein
MHGHGVSAQPVRMSVCEPHAACRWPQLETTSVPRPPGPQNGMRTREPDRMCQCGGTASQSSPNHPPAPQTRRAGSVARSSIWRALHGRTAERPAQPCHGGTRAARRPRRPLMMPPQPPPLRAALSPPLRRPGVPEMLGHGRGRVGRGGGSSLPTFGTASASVPQIQAHLHLVV